MRKSENSTSNKFNRRTAEQKAATKRLTSRIVISVSVALVFIFIVFTFVTTNFMGNDSMVIEVAYRTTESDVIDTTGFVIRDEEYIENDTDGVLVYQVSNGEKVPSNGVIANIYEKESDAVNFQKICDIEEEINELNVLNNISNSVNIGLDSVNNQLIQKHTSFIAEVNQRDFNNISSVQNDLLSAIYRKQIITGDQWKFDDKIAELEEEKASLESVTSDSICSISSSDSGYFVSSIDGYESAFSVDELSQISSSALEKVKPKKYNKDDYVGKVIKGVNWYIACPVTPEQAVAITYNSENIKVKVPYASSEYIPANVVCVNQFSNEDEAVVILECNYMSSAFAQIRNESVEICLNTYEGLKVSKKALHDDYVSVASVDEAGKDINVDTLVQGVYVKYGRQLSFKQVYITYSSDEFVICSEASEGSSTLKLYDEVIVEGDDLYDGKIIN